MHILDEAAKAERGWLLPESHTLGLSLPSMLLATHGTVSCLSTLAAGAFDVRYKGRDLIPRLRHEISIDAGMGCLVLGTNCVETCSIFA